MVDTFSFKRVRLARKSGEVKEKFGEMNRKERKFANALGNWARKRWAKTGYSVAWLREQMISRDRLERVR